MRRKKGDLIPIERSIIEAASQLRNEGIEEFHGFDIAKKIKDREGARLLTGYGTLYRALGRLQEMGILQSRWEEPLPTDENRPRRRYYRLVGEVESIAPPNPISVYEHKICKTWGLGELGA
jgi:PadR family transcriptional regulator, regulatory protein PadR